MKKEEENSHCGYSHDKDGICENQTCREWSECQEEWAPCEECDGKGYKPKK